MFAALSFILTLQTANSFLISYSTVQSACFRKSRTHFVMLDKNMIVEDESFIHYQERSWSSNLEKSSQTVNMDQRKKYYTGTHISKPRSRRNLLRNLFSFLSFIHIAPQRSLAQLDISELDDVDPEEEIRALRIASELMRESAAINRRELPVAPEETDLGYPSTDVRRLRAILLRITRLTQVTFAHPIRYNGFAADPLPELRAGCRGFRFAH